MHQEEFAVRERRLLVGQLVDRIADDLHRFRVAHHKEVGSAMQEGGRGDRFPGRTALERRSPCVGELAVRPRFFPSPGLVANIQNDRLRQQLVAR